jgi:hypothetical protein
VGKRKQAKQLAQRLGFERAAAYHDARRLAIQIADGGAHPPVDVYSYGLVLNDGEQPYRVFWMHWHMREIWTNNRSTAPHVNSEFAVWPQPQPAHLMLTDQRIACRDHHNELFSIYWHALSGYQVDISAERITIDYDDGRAGAFTGTAAPLLAVAAVAHLSGNEGLLQHPAIRALHACSASLRSPPAGCTAPTRSGSRSARSSTNTRWPNTSTSPSPTPPSP